MTTPAQQLAETTEGPALIGVFVNLVLYGVMISQAMYYFTTYQKDPTWIKVYVGILALADSLNAIFLCAWIYRVLINHFGDEAALGVGDWIFESEQAFTGIIGFQVQMFYAWRVWKLFGNRWIVAAIVIPSAIGGLSGIGTAIAIGIKPDFFGLQQLEGIIIPWLLGEGISDIIITAALTWYLHKHKGGHTRTDTLISRVMNLIVSNGLLTATFAIGDLICYFSTDEAWHLIFNFPLCKLYGNSVMSTLNARAMFMTLSPEPTTANYPSDTGLRFPATRSDISGILASAVDKGHQTQIMVNVERHEMTDIRGNHLDNDSDLKAGIVV